MLKLYVSLCIMILVSITSNGQTIEDTSLISQIDKRSLLLNFSLNLKNGIRFKDDPYQKPGFILRETRLQMDAMYLLGWFRTKGKIDFGYDHVFRYPIVNLREMYIEVAPYSWWNIKAGRQLLSWGNGDQVFINDLFPKDYKSIFVGRDMQYLIMPSDAVKLTISPSWLQLDIVFTPQFENDNYISGARITFYNHVSIKYRGRDNRFYAIVPKDFLKDRELAWRIKKSIKGLELSLYGYYGYWKSPEGFILGSNLKFFPKLNVHGLGIKKAFGGGVLTFELGYYHSKENSDGTKINIRSSEWKWLINFKRDFNNALSIGLQIYSENKLYNNYFPTYHGIPVDKHLNTLTFRISKKNKNLRTEFGAFTYYSITNKDAFISPYIIYSINEFIKIDLAARIFTGKHINTYWSQFQYNSNVNLGLEFDL